MKIIAGKKYRVTINGKTTVVIARNTQKQLYDGELFDYEVSPKTYIIDKACEKIFGKTCFWLADNGISGYGQVFRPVLGGGNTSVTDFCGLDIEPIAQKRD